MYKYYKFSDYTEQIFTANEIYFPSPNEFNDPFDSKVRHVFEGPRYQKKTFLRERLCRMYPDKSRREINQMVRTGIKTPFVQAELDRSENGHRDKMGIYCMTEKRDNILMWAHYSEHHTGFCLEFDAQNEFFARALEVKYEVKYASKLPTINIAESDHMDNEQLADRILTKAKDWEYEQEWRIVNHWEGPGIKRFPPSALTGVIMGCRISDAHRTFLTGLVKNRDPRPKVYQAQVKKGEFGLDIVHLDY